MVGASGYRRTLAALILFTVAAGDFWRYLLSWWGWGAIAVTLIVLAVIELVRSRADLRRVPIWLLVFLGFATLSILWSFYPGATALGLALTFGNTIVALFVALCLNWSEVLAGIGTAVRWVLGLSLLFELIVSVFVRDRLLPFWVDYSDLDKIPAAFYWSRNLLFEGGRIQGIVGNANLLGMIALVGLVLFTVRLFARNGSPVWNTIWLVIAVGTLLLTRSSTVTVAIVVLVLVTLFLLAVRATTGRVRLGVTIGGVALGVGAIVAAILARAQLLKLLGRSSDLTNRFDIWAAVTDLAMQRPVAGWGWVGYWNPFVAPFDELVVIRGVRYLQAHNAWLDVFLQLGALGLVIFAGFVLAAYARSWRFASDLAGPRPGENSIRWPETAVPFLLLSALLVQSLAESRLLVELGWTVLVIVAVKTSWRDAEGVLRRRR